MFQRSLVFCALAVVFSGCTHNHLKKHHNKHMNSLTDLLYEQTLSNIAMIHCTPGALPHVAVLGSSSTQVTDNNSGDVGLTWNPHTLVSESFGISGSRTLAENWNASPVVDPDKLRNIQAALRLMTRGYQILYHSDKTKNPEDKYYKVFCQNTITREDINLLLEVGFLSKPKKADVVDSETFPYFFYQPEKAKKYAVDLELEMHRKLPTCWYGISKKSNRPKDKCHAGLYEGCCGDYVAWVNANGIDKLTRATLTLQDLATLEATVSTVEIKRIFDVKKKIGEDGEGNPIYQDDGTVEIVGTARGSIDEHLLRSPVEREVEREKKRLKAKKLAIQIKDLKKVQDDSESFNKLTDDEKNKLRMRIQAQEDRLNILLEKLEEIPDLKSLPPTRSRPLIITPSFINPQAITP